MYILSLARVAADRPFANADKVAIPSLPFQGSGSNAGAQSLFGSNSGNGAVLYSLQCSADAATTVAVRMVRDAASAAGFGVGHRLPWPLPLLQGGDPASSWPLYATYLKLLDSDNGNMVAEDDDSGGASDGSTPYNSRLDVACAPGQVGADRGHLAHAGWSRAGGLRADWARRGRLSS